MGVYALYIEKREAYFGGARVFGNTYHFETPPGVPFNDSQTAVAVANAEKQITQATVEFVAWRTWGPTDGNIIDNIVRDSGVLGGAGVQVNIDAMYREACLLVRWPLPRSPVLNRKRWLRKFIRLPQSNVAGLTAGQTGGYEALTTAQRNGFVSSYAQVISDLANGGPALCTFNGTNPNAPPEVMPYLYTRQIGN